MEAEEERENGNGNGNGLVLYAFHHNFHSQKVLMALREKGIPFVVRTVDVTRDEQFDKWFLNMNPWGTLPVLKDGVKTIPDSKRIIEYLEDNFSNGDYVRLIPAQQDVAAKVKDIHEKVCQISPFMITMGTILHNRWCSNLRYPYSVGCVRKALKASLFSSCETIMKHAAKNQEFCEILLQKGKQQEFKTVSVASPDVYLEILENVEHLLDEIEIELSKHDINDANRWLFDDSFTIADISLTVLMDRLARLGVDLWSRGVRPHLEIYYQRVQQRSSYLDTMPTFKTDLCFFLKTRGSLILGAGTIVTLTIATLGFLYIRK